MNKPLVRHPSQAELQQYGLGRLKGPTCDWIEAHVAECDECCAALLQLSDDTFVRLAQHAVTKSLDSVAIPSEAPTPAAPAKASARIPREIPAELRNHPRYRVLGLVGVGGMGAVFKAEHRVMERLVALKVIHGEFVDNAQAVERFTREVKAAARLAHPNIVAAFDAEQAGDLHFLVMEFVDGVSLDRYVAQQGPLAPLAAARLARQAALALDHAHQRGMVHRDIKPQNLMLRRGGQLKVLDFGLARLAEAPRVPPPTGPGNPELSEIAADAADAFGGQRTMTGMLLGTPDYLAPEQARDPRSADIRADIYALGCTLYYLLRGSAPFAQRPLRETLLAHAAADRRPLLAALRDTPLSLRDLLGRMLAADPAKRFQTPAQLAKALAKVIAELEAPSAPLSTPCPAPSASPGSFPPSPSASPVLSDLPAGPALHPQCDPLGPDLSTIDAAWVRQAPTATVGERGGGAVRSGAGGHPATRGLARALRTWRWRPAMFSRTHWIAAALLGAVLSFAGWWAFSSGGNEPGPDDDSMAIAKQRTAGATSGLNSGESSRANSGWKGANRSMANDWSERDSGLADNDATARAGVGARSSGGNPGIAGRLHVLPENIPGRQLVLFVLPKRDLWMPDYGPLRGQLERSGRVKVVTASTSPGPCAIHAKSPQPDTLIEAEAELTPGLLSQRDFAAVIFVGYDTTPFIRGSHASATKQIIAGMAAQGKPVGSICVGQTVLAHHGVLAGRAAAWGEFLAGQVSKSQARWQDGQPVVIDRSGGYPVVTAATDRDAVALANAILELLDGG